MTIVLTPCLGLTTPVPQGENQKKNILEGETKRTSGDPNNFQVRWCARNKSLDVEFFPDLSIYPTYSKYIFLDIQIVYVNYCKPLQTVYLRHVLNLENYVSKDTHPSKSQNPGVRRLSRSCWSSYIWKNKHQKKTRATVNANYTPIKTESSYRHKLQNPQLDPFAPARLPPSAFGGKDTGPERGTGFWVFYTHKQGTQPQLDRNWTKQMRSRSIFLAVTRPSGFWRQDLEHVATCCNHLQHKYIYIYYKLFYIIYLYHTHFGIPSWTASLLNFRMLTSSGKRRCQTTWNSVAIVEW